MAAVSLGARSFVCLFHDAAKPVLTVLTVRDYSTPATEQKPLRISANLSFRPATGSHLEPGKRPLVLIYGWLVAKAQHIHKYGDFYLGKGFDVLHIKINPTQLLWPRRAQGVISQIADFVTEEPRRTQPILVHGFSVGGYLYGETLVKFTSDPKRFGNMSERVKGQIFDSPVDYKGVPYGVSMAVTPVPVLQKTLKTSLDVYLKLFRHSVTKYYERSSATFYENPLRCPSLVFYSKADRIGTPGPIENLIRGWKNGGAPVQTKCWEDTPHVEHFRYHPVQYIGAVNTFLTSIQLQPEIAATSKEAGRVLQDSKRAASVK